jgi:hypothetical protein
VGTSGTLSVVQRKVGHRHTETLMAQKQMHVHHACATRLKAVLYGPLIACLTLPIGAG